MDTFWTLGSRRSPLTRSPRSPTRTTTP